MRPLLRSQVELNPSRRRLLNRATGDARQGVGWIVGSRGLGGSKGLVLGSVSHHIAHHAICPVVVTPPDVPSPPA
ncbi:MAG: universal stress protein [Acidimicrobiales bacterium]